VKLFLFFLSTFVILIFVFVFPFQLDIKVWMLTGDKLETAENIAKSCKLILADFELLVMSDKNPKVIRKMMTEVLWRRFK